MTNHTLKWEGVWRELGCLARSTSFAVREESGHSLKSALSVSPELFSTSQASSSLCCFSMSSVVVKVTRSMFLLHLLSPHFFFFFFLCSTRCLSIPEILAYSPAEVLYCGSARLVVHINACPSGEHSFSNTDCMSGLQELAGYTGGDVSFLKEDVELQVNRRLFWDSVGHRMPAKSNQSCAAGVFNILLSHLSFRLPLGLFCCFLHI